MKARTELKYSLPLIRDDENDEVKILVLYGNSSSFTSFKNNIFEFNPREEDYVTYVLIVLL